MKVIDELTREQLIRVYLERESQKGKKKIDGLLDFDNPNQMNDIFSKYEYKAGVITGFKKWGYVKIYKSDLMRCAIVNTIKEFYGKRRLSELIGTTEFRNWEPDRKTTWYETLSIIDVTKYPKDLPIILRPAVSGEHPSDWYIEDGSGRSIAFFRRLVNENSDEGFMVGYIGHKPDISSIWLSRNLEGYFVPKYNEKRDYLDKVS